MVKKILQSKWFTPVIVIALGFIALSVLEILPSAITIQKEVWSFRQKIAETQSKIAELEKNKEFMTTDVYLERQARQKLNYKMPDEKVVYIYRNTYNQGQESIGLLKSNGNKDESANLWQKIINWVKGK